MTIDELIERLKALPKDVRRRPLMDGKPAVGYRLAPLSHISVEKVLAAEDESCGMADPELTDAENVAEAGDRYVMSAKNALPDAGAYQCTITNGKDESTLKDVRLVVTADNKVGLYDNQGKEIK